MNQGTQYTLDWFEDSVTFTVKDCNDFCTLTRTQYFRTHTPAYRA